MTKTERNFVVMAFVTSVVGGLHHAAPAVLGMFVVCGVWTAVLALKQIAIDVILITREHHDKNNAT